MTSERDRYQKDLQDYPETKYADTYRGYQWTMKRVNGHWCGYLYNLTSEEINNIKGDIHGGITGGFTDSMGLAISFDCAHYDDYEGFIIDYLRYLRSRDDDDVIDIFEQSGTYKDYNWVLNHIKELIEKLHVLNHIRELIEELRVLRKIKND